MSYIYEKSAIWRWVVASGRSSRSFMLAFAGICFVLPIAVGQLTMNATSYNDGKLEKELLKRGREDSLVMGKVNKERLAQLLGEIQRKENTEDRYKAALRGETLTGTPEARIRGGGGSSVSQFFRLEELTDIHEPPGSCSCELRVYDEALYQLHWQLHTSELREQTLNFSL
ncbi:hypothetical protein R1sor_014898 [Riccia sorocarpa]|uniref:Uncharacterized protein n=1 Tax=Riccia sorocarpa TaxID=122646 RepID=A0ABD3HDK2_9MARC